MTIVECGLNLSFASELVPATAFVAVLALDLDFGTAFFQVLGVAKAQIQSRRQRTAANWRYPAVRGM